MRGLNTRIPQLFRSLLSHQFLVVFVLASLSVSSGCVGLARNPNIIVSSDLSNITIVAENVSRAQILGILRTEYQIEVRPYDLADEHVSVKIENVPLDIAIARLLPEGTRYVLRIGDRELTVSATSKGPKAGEEKLPTTKLPTKDKTHPLPPEQRVAIKVSPEEWREPRPVTDEDSKPAAKSVLDVPEAKGPKVRREISTTERSARLSFLVTEDNVVELVHAAIVEGDTVESGIVRGSFLFVLRSSGGDIVHFGSFGDPLEVHSYLDDGTHTLERAKQGHFGIWIPGELFLEDKLAELNLEFYDARNVSLPITLDEKTIREAVNKAETVARLEGAALIQALSEGARQ